MVVGKWTIFLSLEFSLSVGREGALVELGLRATSHT